MKARYFDRTIDGYLAKWAAESSHKPLLVRGARQVGKSTAIRNLGKSFNKFIEINFERNPEIKQLFIPNLDVNRIVTQLSAILGVKITEGDTLLFFDEIQECQEAIMSLRFFKEDLPGLHVVAAGSLLEFALAELPTFGVGRIHSIFMYPMSFDEFLIACGKRMMIEQRDKASSKVPLPEVLHEKLVELLRIYMLVGGMPAVVSKWVETSDFLSCAEVQDDLAIGYEADFPKYKNKVDPELLRLTLRSIALQSGKKFNYSRVGNDYKTDKVKYAVDLLILAGLVVPVLKTSANGIPFAAESSTDRKLYIFDTGISLRILNMTLGNEKEVNAEILTASASQLVNKGNMAECLAGLEMIRYSSPNMRKELYYWSRDAKNSQAEIDYVLNSAYDIIPMEIKANVQGGMKSLWMFMREKRLVGAVRSSLENFGRIIYNDSFADSEVERLVEICPLYSLSSLPRIMAALKAAR